MCLDEIIEYIEVVYVVGKDVVRVYFGDLFVYGVIGEQICCLQFLGINFEIIFGVIVMFVLAVWLGKELILLGII